MKEAKNNNKIKRGKQKKIYKHIDQLERDRIEAMLASGCNQANIARILQRNKGSISREIKKNSLKINKEYKATKANHKSYVRRKYARCNFKKINKDIDLQNYIIDKLKKYWSPDEISGRMKIDKEVFYASKTAIYEWLYTERAKENRKYLKYKRNKPKKRKAKPGSKRTLIPNRVGIENRPKVVASNKEYSHHETDTIVSGKKTRSKSSLVVDYEKKAKYVCMKKIKSLKPELFNKALSEIDKIFTEIKTRTMDNGIENRNWEELAVKTYFCDPYSSWQKGGVENVNAMIRRFIPKGVNISKYSNSYIKIVEDILNNKPRKSLNYRTPLEVMTENNLLINE